MTWRATHLVHGEPETGLAELIFSVSHEHPDGLWDWAAYYNKRRVSGVERYEDEAKRLALESLDLLRMLDTRLTKEAIDATFAELDAMPDATEDITTVTGTQIEHEAAQ